jgi:hypothetical protein
LRQPRKQKDTSRESLIPKVPIDLSMLASGLTWPVDDKSKKLIEPSEPPMIEDVEQLLAAAVANGRSVPCHAEPEVKPLYGGLADLSELDRMLHCAASGNG